MKNITLFFLFIISIAYSQQAYYNDVNLTLTGLNLKTELATKVTNTHTNFLTYTPDVWEASRITDEDPNNSSNVILLYGWEDGSDADVTNDISRNKSDNGGNVGDWNREHTYPQSLGNPALGSTGPGADAHHLRPTDVQRNGSRANRKFADGSGNSGTTGANWYPGDEWKGDVARMMMFMYIRYGNRCLPSTVGVGSNSGTPDDMIDLFLDWNAEDPVSVIEDNRNNYHDSNGTYAQGNRNPFIDNPYLATIIWGGPDAEDRWGIFNTDTQAPTVPTNVQVSNETANTIDVSWTASTDDTGVTEYEIYVDGVLNQTVAVTGATVTGLTPETTYVFTVLAKDAAGNSSAQSSAVNGTTTASSGNSCGGGTSITETFENIPSDNSSGYDTRNWTGDAGGTWTATDARTDQTLTTKAIAIRNGTLTSPSVAGGIGNLTVTTRRVFTGGNGTFTVKVNGTSVGTVPYSDTNQTTTISNIDIQGNVVISFEDKATTSDRVVIDDLSWTCFEPLSVDDNELSGLRIHPNPSSGNIVIDLPNISEDAEVTIFDITGKLILGKDVNTSHKSTMLYHLPKGILLVKISTDQNVLVKKLVIQ